MRPAVAITLVELGLPLGDVRTALNLEKGLAILARLNANRGLTELDKPAGDGPAGDEPVQALP